MSFKDDISDSVYASTSSWFLEWTGPLWYCFTKMVCLIMFFADYCNISTKWRNSDPDDQIFLLPVVCTHSVHSVHMLTENNKR